MLIDLSEAPTAKTNQSKSFVVASYSVSEESLSKDSRSIVSMMNSFFFAFLSLSSLGSTDELSYSPPIVSLPEQAPFLHFAGV